MESSHHLDWLISALVGDGVELGNEVADVYRRLAFLPEEVDALVPGVVVHQDKEVLVPPVDGTPERAGHVGVDEPAGMRWLVRIALVRHVGRVRLLAMGATPQLALGDGGRHVGRHVRQLL